MFAAFEAKISLKAATLPNEQKIVAKVTESLLYYKAYERLESSKFPFVGPKIPVHVFYNGYSNQSLLSSDGVFYGTEEFQLSLKISNYQKEEAGEYRRVVYTDSGVISLHFNDCNYYYVLVQYDLRIPNIILFTETLHIYTAGETVTIIMEYGCSWH